MLEACNNKKVAVRILTCSAINLFVSVITNMKMELMILRSLAGARRDFFFICAASREGRSHSFQEFTSYPKFTVKDLFLFKNIFRRIRLV